MNIPKKYEDVVAERDAALVREAALREEVSKWKGILVRRMGERTEFINERNDARDDRDALQQRLTVAERLLHRVVDSSELGFEQDAPEKLESLEADICAALKPAAEEEGS